MARTAYSTVQPHLANTSDFMGKVDPLLLIAKAKPHLRRIVSASLHSIRQRHFPGVGPLPEPVHQELVSVTIEKIQESMPVLWADLTEILADKERGLDSDRMVVSTLASNASLLNGFFMKMGAKEFRFIERTGAVLGFLCGIVQLVAFNNLSPFGRAMLLPVTGFFLGIMSNWLALQMCFKPVHPIHLRCCGLRLGSIQGRFLAHQNEVAVTYAKLLCDNFFDIDKILGYVMSQPDLWASLRGAYARHTGRVLRQTLGSAAWIAPLAIGSKEFARVEEDLQAVVAQHIARADDMLRVASGYITAATAADILKMNSVALQRMPPDEFEGLLHPVFQEDEWILVLLGGVLGAIVGAAQVYFLSV